jgi:TonB-linked SusC/RagA family outer membrane protein
MLMKRLSFMIVLSIVGVFTLFAQTIVITGTVSSAEGKGPIPGATVQVKGTGIGTLTNAQGNYTLNVPPDATAIIFSFVGMKRQEVAIAGRSVIDVEMESDVLSLGEVVVTGAYGIKSTLKSTSSLTQVIPGDKLNEVRETNINNALAGKVSGIQFLGQSSVALDRTGSIRLRGDGGFGIGNSVLYVVDGTILPNPGVLNLDDIEDVTVLSGPGASALLGSQGANGAIIITTKKAKVSGGRTTGIEFNSGLMRSSVYVLPAYQNDYAGGIDDIMTQYNWKEGDPVEWKPLDGKYYPDYSDDRNWGPRMEGQEYIPWYSWYPGTKYTGTTALLVPQPDNVRDFYNKGLTYNNNLSFSKVGDGYNIRATVGNIAIKGNIPRSSQNKTTLSLKTSYDLTKKLTFNANINFVNTLTKGEFEDEWVNQTTGSFNEWFHRDLDMNIMKELRDLRTPDGIYASWNHYGPDVYNSSSTKDFYAALFWYNHYTYFDLVNISSKSDQLFGDLSLNYEIINGLNVRVTYRRQQNNGWHEEQYSSYLKDSGIWTSYFNDKLNGYYYTGGHYSARENIESLATFTKKISNFTINANAGSDFFNAISKSTSANTVHGLTISNLFSIANSIDQPVISNYRTKEKYRALFFRGDVGFKDYLFGEFTLRNDWYSTLPPTNNSILSKSFGVSFIFSDFLKLPFQDYGKVRVSWGEIPTTIGIYSYPDFQYNINLFQWDGNLLMSTPDQLVDRNIRGAVKTQKEIGLELRFLKNRVGISATYWDGSETDIPYPVSIAGYSGFLSKYLNTGKITKKGLDITMQLKPVLVKNLSYDINIAFSYLIKNKVVRIAEGISSFQAELLFIEGTPAMVHTVGKPWGELMGYGMKMWEGKPLLDENGLYVIDENKYFGSVLPKFTGGIQNTFTILKHFTVFANIDYQIGGKFYSTTELAGAFDGITARTAGTNFLGIPIREKVEYGGGLLVTGVDETTHKDVAYRVDAFKYFTENYVYDPFVYDKTYVKLRELSIGYNVPVEKIRWISDFFQSMNISFVALNPWLIYSAAKGLDPSEISSASGEVAQFPGTRSFGINIKANF